MSDFKLNVQVYAWIIKHYKSKEDEEVFHQRFRCSHIANELGVSNQSVLHHLNLLTQKGFLVKYGRDYVVEDFDGLTTFAFEKQVSNKGLHRAEATKVWGKSLVDALQELVDFSIVARALQLKEANKVKNFLVTEIDSTIAHLKKERRYLLEKELSAGSARKRVNTVDPNKYKFSVLLKGDDTTVANDPTTWFDMFNRVMQDRGFEFDDDVKTRRDNFYTAMKETD